ncbi:Benzoate 1 2-dioxygenase [Paramagnetospirillum magnetotacticum MS-1]|uniref:Benzoate 1 2-dioxygenase n=1 Tax=Paramagnetospirillum magnetotacticum MS-1 TaxID=272627 RepID=A0A0C2UFF6_PARME|nr:hypothetical protein [Paramagnetospirillum magnetotacticum]KIM00248.1 Benzoate 1 2-dioxygenase [Paramagnetospirillum magnetotacticum MS-1]
MIRRLAFALCLIALPVTGAEVICPDLSTAQQVGNCASEQELKFSFTGYCSDNQRLYDKEDGSCLSLEHYKKIKDVSLWEAGEFQGYLHCSLPAETIRASKLHHMGAVRIGPMTRVVCSYDNGLDLTYRTKAPCTVEGSRAVCKD